MGRAARAEIIKKIEEKRGSRVICYLTSDRTNANGQVGKDAIPIFYEHLRKMDTVDRVEVFVFTLGGDTLAAFGLARLLREFAQWVGVIVPEKCQSAGTLLALGANEIVMGRAALLSPIDPSLVRPLNPAVELNPGQRQLVPLSVESVIGFKTLVSDEWGIKGEAELGAAFKLLAERVHPLALGDVMRTRQQIELLATHLLREHRTDDDNVQKIISTLTKGLGSHDYLISRKEARALLGSQVHLADAALEDLIWALYSDFAEEMKLGKPYDAGMEMHAASGGAPSQPGQPRMVQVIHHVAVVESIVNNSDVFERELRVSEVQLPPQILAMQPGVGPKGYQQEVVRQGWRHYNSTP